jgi:hypothetical protein
MLNPLVSRSQQRIFSVAGSVVLIAVSVFATGCSSHSASQGGGVSNIPTVDPTTQPLPSNIPPAQQEQIRESQARGYALAQQAKQRGNQNLGKK